MSTSSESKAVARSGGLIAKFATVGGATMSSRVLGLVREALMAATLAAGPVADVFYTCFRFPNLFRRLFAEGAFNIAFVPLFAKELEAGGEEAAQKFGQEVFSVLASWLIVFTGLALVLMPYLVANVIGCCSRDCLRSQRTYWCSMNPPVRSIRR